MNQEMPQILPRWTELPSIELYSDQVVTLITQVLEPVLGSHPESGRKRDTGILTGAMLNNYVKMKIIPAPVKKQYTRTQVATLMVLCILKQVYSIQDISALIDIALDNTKLSTAYNSFCKLFEAVLYCIKEKKDFQDITAENDRVYLLKSVLISCCTKFYVRNTLHALPESANTKS